MNKCIIPAILVSVLLSACQEQSALVDSEGIVFHRGNGAEPDTLDPHRSEETAAAEILRDIYEGLVTETVDSEIVPGVAESWTISGDGLTYTFTIREEARWSNGEPVAPEHFVRALQRTIDPNTAATYAPILYPIVNARAINRGDLPPSDLGVAVKDPRTLEIRLTAPTPYFLQLLTHASTYPVHPSTLESDSNQFARPGQLISNGAYTLTEWQVQSHIKLTRNSQYWDNGNVQIDTVYYYPTEDIDSEFKRFRAGELHFTDQIPNAQYQNIKKTFGDQLQVRPYLSTYYYSFDMDNPPFDNTKLRQALNIAIDREILTEKITGVGEVPAFHFVPPGVSGYTPQSYDWAELPKTEREDLARRLYAEAGYSEETPLRTEVRYNTSETHKKIAVAIASMWKDVLGAETRLVNEEWKAMLQTRKDRGAWEIMRFSWNGDYNDPYTFLEIFRSNHGQNLPGFADPVYDDLLDEASAQTDPAERLRLLHDAERRLLDQAPIVPVYFYVTKHLVSPDVKGFRPNIMDRNYSRHYRIESGTVLGQH